MTFAKRRGSAAAAVDQFPKSKTVLFDDENTQQQEFLNGNATAVTVATPTQALLEEKYPGCRPGDRTAHRADQRRHRPAQGDPASLAVINAWIEKRTADGWLKERFDYWFKGRAWANQVAAN